MARQANGIAERQWRERLRRWQAASGLSVVDFCDLEGVSSASFYQWRKRLGEEARAGREVPPVFVPVEVVEGPRLSHSELPRVDGVPDQRSGDIEIKLPGGVTIHLREHVDELHLRTVLRAVLAESTSC